MKEGLERWEEKWENLELIYFMERRERERGRREAFRRGVKVFRVGVELV